MMNSKMIAAGGMTKKSMPMATKDGKKVPAFAADGVGKMAAGGMSKKGYAAGGAKAGSKSTARNVGY
jgi:hypothetical protein